MDYLTASRILGSNPYKHWQLLNMRRGMLKKGSKGISDEEVKKLRAVGTLLGHTAKCRVCKGNTKLL